MGCGRILMRIFFFCLVIASIVAISGGCMGVPDLLFICSIDIEELGRGVRVNGAKATFYYDNIFGRHQFFVLFA